MKKIIGIFICMLFIGTFIPVVNSSNQITNEIYNYDCICGSDFGIIKKDIPQDSNYVAPSLTINGVPDYFNWKDFGGQDWTTPAKAQSVPKQCGSCWIFGGIGILECVINIREGSADIDPDLSEQYVLSCLPNATYPLEPGAGCNGGDTILALQYMMEESENGNYHNGALLEECFPYQADDTIPCEDKCPDWTDKLVPIKDCFEWWSTGSDEDINLIKNQVIEKGGVLVCMLATTGFWDWSITHHDPNDYYPYYETDDTNHIVDIIGWKDDPSIGKGGYWICKNSWGPDHGYDGFFNIEYGSLNIDNLFVNWVDYDPDSYEWNDEPNPPSTTTITGLINGNIETEYEYTFNSVDPEGKEVKYYISWGDGEWEWTDYYSSGEDVKVKHTWDDEGDFSIISLAMNSNNNIGSWGTLDISMPINKAIDNFNPWLFRLIQRFSVLEFLI